ncbi:unnamed protein product [Mucor hiemalis]
METLLYQTLSSDNLVRRHATHELQKAQLNDYAYYAKYMCSILANEEFDDHIRLSAGLALKNSLGSQQFGWLYTDQRSRTEIKTKILYLLRTEKRNVANVVSQILATIAQVELPGWNSLIDILLDNITSLHFSCTLKQSTLQTIGYICELVDPNILSKHQCNALLTAIIEGARREEPDIHTRLVAMKALSNSLEFIKDNFENTAERNYILKVVCDGATQHVNSNIDLQISSYECLNRIMQLYYYKMEDYMSSYLFNLTINGMNQTDEKIKSQAIEFWCTVCELEIDFLNENASSFNFANQSVTYILPNVLKLLVKCNDYELYDDEDETNISQQAAHCLTLFAQCTKDAVVPQVIDFISANLLVRCENSYQQLNWGQKEASVIAFGCMVEGPNSFKIISLVNQMLPVLFSCSNDTNQLLQIAASWTLYQTVKKTIRILDLPKVLPTLIAVVLEGLHSQHQKVIYNSCLSLMSLSEELKPVILANGVEDNQKVHTIAETGPLSAFTKQILLHLLTITTTTNAPYDAKCRSTIYETISSIVKYSSMDCNDCVRYATSSVLDRLGKLNSLAKLKEYHDHNFWNLQSSLLGVLLQCIYRLKNEGGDFSDLIMSTVHNASQVYLNDSNSLNVIVVEDAFLLVTALINVTGKRFQKYIDHFLPELSRVLARQESQGKKEMDSLEEARLSLISVGIISDLSCTFGDAIFPFAGEFMKLLINNLKSKSLHRNVKPATLSCIGDVAQAMGPFFVQYIDTTMMILRQAGNMQADKENIHSVEYIDSIRVGTIEAFTGLAIGSSQNAATKEIMFPFIIDFIFYVSSVVMEQKRSEQLTKSIIGLLGDIARLYGKRVKHTLVENPLNHMLIEHSKGELYFSKSTREIAHWAQQIMIKIYHTK